MGIITRIWTRFMDWMMPESQTPEVKISGVKELGDYWPQPEVIAAQLAASDIPGSFSKSVAIRPGWRGLYYRGAQPQLLEPGINRLHDLYTVLTSNFGSPLDGHLVVYDASEIAIEFTDIELTLKGPIEASAIGVNIQGALVCMIDNPDAFFKNLQKRTREVLSFDAAAATARSKGESVWSLDLAHRLVGALSQGLKERYRTISYDSIAQADIESAAHELLTREMNACGLRFVRFAYIKVTAPDLTQADKDARTAGKEAVEKLSKFKRAISEDERQQELQRQQNELLLSGMEDQARMRLQSGKIEFKGEDDFQELEEQYRVRKMERVNKALQENLKFAVEKETVEADAAVRIESVNTDLYRRIAQLQQERIITAADVESLMAQIQERKEDRELTRKHMRRMLGIAHEGEASEHENRNTDEILNHVLDRKRKVNSWEIEQSEKKFDSVLRQKRQEWDAEHGKEMQGLQIYAEKSKMDLQAFQTLEEEKRKNLAAQHNQEIETLKGKIATMHDGVTLKDGRITELVSDRSEWKTRFDEAQKEIREVERYLNDSKDKLTIIRDQTIAVVAGARADSLKDSVDAALRAIDQTSQAMRKVDKLVVHERKDDGKTEV